MNPTPPHGGITEEAIAAMLDRFYADVRRDPMLGPVFARAIADDAWPAHMRIINDFWTSVLLKTARYHRNPFTIHRRIDGLSPAMFARWLALFRESCDAQFAPEAADLIHGKAEMIASSLQAGLFFSPARRDA